MAVTSVKTIINVDAKDQKKLELKSGNDKKVIVTIFERDNNTITDADDGFSISGDITDFTPEEIADTVKQYADYKENEKDIVRDNDIKTTDNNFTIKADHEYRLGSLVTPLNKPKSDSDNQSNPISTISPSTMDNLNQLAYTQGELEGCGFTVAPTASDILFDLLSTRIKNNNTVENTKTTTTHAFVLDTTGADKTGGPNATKQNPAPTNVPPTNPQKQVNNGDNKVVSQINTGSVTLARTTGGSTPKVDDKLTITVKLDFEVANKDESAEYNNGKGKVNETLKLKNDINKLIKKYNKLADNQQDEKDSLACSIAQLKAKLDTIQKTRSFQKNNTNTTDTIETDLSQVLGKDDKFGTKSQISKLIDQYIASKSPADRVNIACAIAQLKIRLKGENGDESVKETKDKVKVNDALATAKENVKASYDLTYQDGWFRAFLDSIQNNGSDFDYNLQTSIEKFFGVSPTQASKDAKWINNISDWKSKNLWANLFPSDYTKSNIQNKIDARKMLRDIECRLEERKQLKARLDSLNKIKIKTPSIIKQINETKGKISKLENEIQNIANPKEKK